MAALLYTAGSTSLYRRGRWFNNEAHNPRKLNLVVSCSYTSFPTKPTKRKNYLRQKILKTQPKSLIPKLPLSKPIIPIDFPSIQETKETEVIQEIEEFDNYEDSKAGNYEVGIFEESREGEVSLHRNVGILSKNQILKYGLWLFGAFVFQTVCAICFFGSTDFENSENKKSSVLEVGENGKGNSKVRIVLNGNRSGKIGVRTGGVDLVVHMDVLEMERKVEEIRVMASEARKKERLESKRNDGTDGGTYSKNEIEEEVDNRLIKLRKKLENVRYKMPASVEYLKKGELDEREGNEALSFKKKHRFKDLSSDPRDKPKSKGFVGTDDESTGKSKESGNGMTKQGQGKVLPNPKEKNSRKSFVAADLKPVKNNAEAVKLSGSSTMDTAVVSNELSKGNDNFKSNGVRDAKSAAKCEPETNFWWLKLPYVLAILMQRRHDGEGGGGLYILKSPPSIDDPLSYIVAFEDRVDATNFCYLLESFFEEMDDFQADIVLLKAKELKEMISGSKRVIVVKRGQLQLYAGQPLADAEMALHAIVKQG